MAKLDIEMAVTSDNMQHTSCEFLSQNMRLLSLGPFDKTSKNSIKAIHSHAQLLS